MRLPLLAGVVAAALLFDRVVSASGQNAPPTVFVHEAQIFGHPDPSPPARTQFGRTVAVSGDTAIVGMPREASAPGDDVGSAHVFVRSGTTWTLQQYLTAPDATAGAFFGDGVALAGDTAVVRGASNAYVFVRSGTNWTLQQVLVGSGGGFLGAGAVTISGDTIVVGSPLEGFQSGAAYVFVRSGSTWTEQQRLVGSDTVGGDRFGASVCSLGDTALVGATLKTTAGGPAAGAAYVFVRSGSTWTQQQKLVAPDGAAGDQFGASAALATDTAILGAPSEDNTAGTDAGSTYVFVRAGTTWSIQQKLLASDGMASDRFGASVSASGDTLVVGALAHDNPGNFDAGAAYVFVRSGPAWAEEQKLVATDTAASDNFGASVSVSADTAVVGAPLDDAAGNHFDAGSTYAFVRVGTTWSEQQKLLASEHATAGDLFGSGVMISGDTLLVGAADDDTPAELGAGSAYVFARAGGVWTEQQKLFASGAGNNDRFGSAVSVSGDTAVIGAPYAGLAGAAYVFVRSGTSWTEQQKLVPPPGLLDEQFGTSVSINGDTVVVGAPAADTAGGLDAGKCYVYVRSGTTWTQQQVITAADGAFTDWFGFSISLSGETLVAGTYSDDNAGGINAGAAYVYVRSGTVWTEQQKLLASDGAADDFFGLSVSIRGDTVLAGAWGDDNGWGQNAGAAYVFVRSGTTWTEQQKLVAADGSPGGGFGPAVSLGVDTAAVGAVPQGPPTNLGAVYVFARSGATWTQQAKLEPPEPEAFDAFGAKVSLDGTTVVAGAGADDTPAGVDAGSVHVYLPAQADVGVAKTDGQTTAVPGQPLTYTITVSNTGPTTAPATSVTDIVPAALLAPTWTCVPTPGSTCTPAGVGSIQDTVSILAGGSLTYALAGTVSPAATGLLTNTVTVAAPAGVDPNPANDSATDIDTLTPLVDLAMAKTDSADPVLPGDALQYTLAVANLGPSSATSLQATDTLPPDLTFVSSVPGPPACVFSTGVLTCSLGTMAPGGSAMVTVNTTVNASAGAQVVNSATVASLEIDPAPANNSDTEPTAVIHALAELSHGFKATYDLAAQPGPVADEDVFRIGQKPYSSYEVVIDATSGDIGTAAGPLLRRIGPDGATVLQSSTAVGTGSSRSLRWRNAGSTTIANETIRVRSAGCTTDCGPDDVYRIRAYETTCAVPRVNNTGTQITVLILQNATDYTISGAAYFLDVSGVLAGVHAFTLGPKATLVLNTATVPGANGLSGSLTVAHDGRYGELTGKTVALEPSAGFSFDSALEARPKD